MSSWSTQFPFIDSSHCEIICDGSYNYPCDNSHNHVDCSGDNICVDLALLTQCVPNACASVTTSTYYLQPIYILYRNFHNLFFYNNGKFTPNVQLGCHTNYRCFIDNNNQYVKKVDPEGIYYPFDLYNILKSEFMSSTTHCWDVCSKIEFEKKIAKIKTLFDVDGLCNITCSLTLDELFLSLEANGVVIDPVSGMPDIHHHAAPPCTTVNITTRFSNCNHQVDIVWPFFVDLSAGFNCSHCGGSHNSRYSCDCTPVHSCEAIVHPQPHPNPPGPNPPGPNPPGPTPDCKYPTNTFTVGSFDGNTIPPYNFIAYKLPTLKSTDNTVRFHFYRAEKKVQAGGYTTKPFAITLLEGPSSSSEEVSLTPLIIKDITSETAFDGNCKITRVDAGIPIVLVCLELSYTLPAHSENNTYYIGIWCDETATGDHLLECYASPQLRTTPYPAVRASGSAVAPKPMLTHPVDFTIIGSSSQPANKLWFGYCVKN
jgi:hypothetical protein